MEIRNSHDFSNATLKPRNPQMTTNYYYMTKIEENQRRRFWYQLYSN